METRLTETLLCKTYLVKRGDGLIGLISITVADAVGFHGEAAVVPHASQQVQVLLVLSSKLVLTYKLASCFARLTSTVTHAVKNLE